MLTRGQSNNCTSPDICRRSYSHTDSNNNRSRSGSYTNGINIIIIDILGTSGARHQRGQVCMPVRPRT